ncbi:hypothetical protein Q5752_001469 [Cryptotrichosporon argae]
MSLPSLDSLHDPAQLTLLLSTLFEPSPPLHALLVPAAHSRVAALRTPLTTYDELIGLCADIAAGWTWADKGAFLAGHPVIGEVKNLSALSGKEQGGATRQVVLDRLAHLNALYAHAFPGLTFITFVNGRPRAAIVPEFEGVLGVPPSLEPIPDGYPVFAPGPEGVCVREAGSDEWRAECARGLADVWRIARARVKGLGLA